MMQTLPSQESTALQTPSGSRDGFTRERMSQVVAAAIQAPSGDNVQPWRFEAQDGGRSLEVYVDASRDASEWRVGALPTLTAVGAALENARQAAAGLFGRALDWTAQETELRPGTSPKVAQMRAGGKLSTPQDPRRVRAIFDRHTHRGVYDGKPLAAAERAAWEAAQGEATVQAADVQVKLLEDPETLRRIQTLLALSTPLILEVPALRSHVFTNIRFPKQHEPLPPDGMPVETLGVGRFDRIAVRLLKNKTIAALAAGLGAGKKMGAGDLRLARTASAFGLILAGGTGTGALLRAGAAMEKMWLACVAAGLSVQPMTSAMLHTWFHRAGETALYSPAQKRSVAGIAQAFTALHADLPQAMPVMLFRIGHAQPIPARCGRRPVDEVLTWKT